MLLPAASLPEVTKRTILMLKQLHPEWGCQRISDELLRGPALAAGAAAVARVLHEAGYQMEERTTHPHPDKERRFERAEPNQLWQTDLFTFVLKRQNRRLYLVALHGRPQPVPRRLRAARQCVRRRWCWRCCGRRSPPTVRRKRSSPTTARST